MPTSTDFPDLALEGVDQENTHLGLTALFSFIAPWPTSFLGRRTPILY